MFPLVDLCCICLSIKKNLRQLCAVDHNNSSYFKKLTTAVPEMVRVFLFNNYVIFSLFIFFYYQFFFS